MSERLYVKPYVHKVRNGCYKAALDVVIDRSVTETYLSEVEYTFADMAHKNAFGHAEAMGKELAEREGLKFGGVILHEWGGADATRPRTPHN